MLNLPNCWVCLSNAPGNCYLVFGECGLVSTVCCHRVPTVHVLGPAIFCLPWAHFKTIITSKPETGMNWEHSYQNYTVPEVYSTCISFSQSYISAGSHILSCCCVCSHLFLSSLAYQKEIKTCSFTWKGDNFLPNSDKTVW